MIDILTPTIDAIISKKLSEFVLLQHNDSKKDSDSLTHTKKHNGITFADEIDISYASNKFNTRINKQAHTTLNSTSNLRI